MVDKLLRLVVLISLFYPERAVEKLVDGVQDVCIGILGDKSACDFTVTEIQLLVTF